MGRRGTAGAAGAALRRHAVPRDVAIPFVWPADARPVRANPATMPFFDVTEAPGIAANREVLSLIRAPQAWPLSRGRGVKIAVLDTAIDATHPALRGRLVATRTFIDRDRGGVGNCAGADGCGGASETRAGHGTHVAGIVALVAPGAEIMPVMVLDGMGTGTPGALAEGILCAVQQGVQVINLSLGMAGADPGVVAALGYAGQRGVVVVASAGNDGLLDAPQWPAAQPGVIAVGATDTRDRKAPFSNYGRGVAICAPGLAIHAPFPGGYASWSGTSMSAAFVSGAVALMRARHPEWGPCAIEERLRRSAAPVAALNPDYAGGLGAGRIDLLGAVL